MRAYYLPATAGMLLVVSACLPWVFLGDAPLGSVTDVDRVSVLALGLTAVLLASLSVITRKNSRHPLLLVGLLALGILFLAYISKEQVAAERAWGVNQAIAIVDNVEPGVQPQAVLGVGVYLGLAASMVLVLFGLTIVVRQVSKPYAEPADDDV